MPTNEFTPRARDKDLLWEEIDGEIVVYDTRKHKAHSLNSTASFVWMQCDGATSKAELANMLAQEMCIDEESSQLVLDYTLDKLNKTSLLDSVSEENIPVGMTRRDVMRQLAILGAGIVLPVVYTLTAPQPVEAASCVSSGKICHPWKPCCIGVCDPSTLRCP